MKGTDFDRHPEDEVFRDFMADLDSVLSRLGICLAVLAVLGLAGLAVVSP